MVAPQFKMFQTGAASEDIESDVEHMIGFGIRHVHFENLAMPVDRFGKPELPDQGTVLNYNPDLWAAVA